MRRLIPVLVMAIMFSLAGQSFAGDTGTYRILNYTVSLTPHSDGTVAIDYYQKWLVTGGHIPWITVGTPNNNFVIAGHGGAVTSVASASQGDWSGVRLDLDADYGAGQTFDASFSIVQRRLFYAEKDNYMLNFTPGWYDRAVTDTLRVSVNFFAELATVTADTQPSLVAGDEMAWSTCCLNPGEHFSIRLSFPVGLFPAGISKSNLRGSPGAGVPLAVKIIILVIVGLVFYFILWAVFAAKRGYSGGRVFYGGGPWGGSSGGRSGGSRSSGGGGGFGGASMSCACACVSCACACACAGGGGAGCARKLEHVCPVCGRKKG